MQNKYVRIVIDDNSGDICAAIVIVSSLYVFILCNDILLQHACIEKTSSRADTSGKSCVDSCMEKG